MLIRLYFIVSFCVVVLYYSDEKERGSLEAGKVADMVILSDNPYEVDPEKLKDIKVKELILSGMPYESAVTPLGKCILRGLFSKKVINKM